MHVRWLSAAPLVLLLTGCAALSGPRPGAALGAGEGKAIPWTSATPGTSQHALATPVPGSAPKRCAGKDMRAGFRGGQAGGLVYLSPQISDCLAGGVPTIELLATDGPIPMTQVPASPTAATDVVLGREFVVRPDLPPGQPVPPPLGGPGEGFVRIAWQQTDTGFKACANGVKQVSSMRLVLPDQTSPVIVENLVDWQGQPLTVCPPYLQVGSIEQAAAVKPLDSPRYWNFTVAVPQTAVAGRTMDFKVSLQNTYYRALQFHDGCPSYIEALAGPNDWTTGKEWYLMNCGPIGAVQPGATVVLAMKIAIPLSAPAGAYTLVWEMDVGEVSYGGAAASVSVMAPAG